MNLTATYERLALAPGTTTEDMVRTYGERMAKGISPVEVKSEEAPIKQIIWQGKDADLGKLPVPTHNAEDGGPYISGGVGISRDPETGGMNAGLYRHQVFSKNEYRHAGYWVPPWQGPVHYFPRPKIFRPEWPLPVRS